MTIDAETHKRREKVVSKEKYQQITGRIPLHKKLWFRNTLRTLAASAALAVGAGIHYVKDMRDKNLEYLDQQQINLDRALSYPKTERMMIDFRDKMLWTVNYAAKNPFDAHALFPEQAAIETEKNLPYWTFKAKPITPQEYSPGAIVQRTRDISRALTERGYKFYDAGKNEDNMRKGKRMLLEAFERANNQRLFDAWLKGDESKLEQYSTGKKDSKEYDWQKIWNDVSIFVARHPEYSFNALKFGQFRPETEEKILRKYASHFGQGATKYDVARMASLYDSMGLSMLKDIEAEKQAERKKILSLQNKLSRN